VPVLILQRSKFLRCSDHKILRQENLFTLIAFDPAHQKRVENGVGILIHQDDCGRSNNTGDLPPAESKIWKG